MKKICISKDCPRYYLCRVADVVMEPVIALKNDDICNASNDYALFERNDATIKSLNDRLLKVHDAYAKRAKHIKAAIDILLEEEKKHDSERKSDT